MPSINSVAATAAPEPRISDAAALDAICAVLNTTDSGADVYQEVALLVRAAGRPFVDDLPVLESQTGQTVHGLPTADVLVDGEPTIRVWVSHNGDLHAVVVDHGRLLIWQIPGGDPAAAGQPPTRR